MLHSQEGLSQLFDLTNVPLKKAGYRLTERELGILQFVLEMKFATLADIHSKFFRQTKSGGLSHSQIWARQRLNHLVGAGHLRNCYEVCATPLYVITPKGYLFLKNTRLGQSLARPLTDVDARFFEHDHQVTKIRLLLESQGQVTEWISERQLLEIEEYKDHFSSEFRPDGIYVTPDGSKVAFELEIARKSKERYQQKIKRYIDLLIHPKVNPPLFHRVHYVCEKPAVLKLVQSYTELFSHLFHFELTQSVQLQKKEQL